MTIVRCTLVCKEWLERVISGLGSCTLLSLRRSVLCMPSPEDPGTTLKSMRVAQNLTLQELAARAGVSRNYLSDVERGKRRPSARWMRDVIEALANHLRNGDAA